MEMEQDSANPRKRKLLLAIEVLALAGLAVSIELTRIYYLVWRNPDYNPACNLTEQVSCSAVALSKYSAVLIGIPNSVLGIAFYLVLLAFIPFRLWTRVRIFAHLENYLALLSVGGFAFAVFLASISSFVLKTFCPWCTVLYVLNLAGTLLIFLALDSPREIARQLQDDFQLLRSEPRYLGTLLALVIAVMILLVIQLNRYFKPPSISAFGNGQPPVELDVSHDPVLGPSQAPVTIVEFSDFQCPFCLEMHSVLNQMRKQFGPRLRVIYKNFPLDSKCNPAVKVSLHPGSCELAYAAECAYQSGCFESFYDKLVQVELNSQSSLLQIAMDCGMSPAEFQSCMAGDRPRKAVARDIEDALKLGIKGTPMLLVNGRILQGSRSEKEMAAIISSALKSQNSAGKK